MSNILLRVIGVSNKLKTASKESFMESDLLLNNSPSF